MKKISKILCFLLLVALSSCFGGKSKNEVDLWSFDYETQELAKRYEAKTGVRINVKLVNPFDLRSLFVTAVTKGSGPDIILAPNDWIGEFSDNNLILSLDQLIDNKKEFEESNFDLAIEAVKYKNKIYAIPAFLESLVLIYNKKFVKNPPKTTNELVKIAMQVKTKHDLQYPFINGMNDPFHAIPFILGYKGIIFDKNNNPRLNSRGTKKALKYMSDLFLKYKIMPISSRNETFITLFLKEKTAMIVTGPWNFKRILTRKKSKNIDIGFAKLPLISATKKHMQPFIGVKSYMISKKCQNPKIAYNFIKFLNSVEAGKIFIKNEYRLHANKNTLKNNYVDKREYLKVLHDQIKHGTPMPNHRKMLFYWGALGKILGDSIMNPQKINQNLDKEQQLLKETIKAYNEKKKKTK